MLVSDLVTLPVSSNDLIRITHLPNATSRAIRKARRNLGNARSLLGWDTDYELTKEMKASLDAAIERRAVYEYTQRTSKAYERTAALLRKQLLWELGQSRSFLQTVERYRKLSVAAEALELDLEVRVETLGDVPYVRDLRSRLSAIQADTALAMQRINSHRHDQLAMIQGSKYLKAKYEQLRIMLRLRMGSELSMILDTVLAIRGRLKAELSNCPHYQTSRRERAPQSCCA